MQAVAVVNPLLDCENKRSRFLQMRKQVRVNSSPYVTKLKFWLSAVLKQKTTTTTKKGASISSISRFASGVCCYKQHLLDIYRGMFCIRQYLSEKKKEKDKIIILTKDISIFVSIKEPQELSNSQKPQFTCSFLLLGVLWSYLSSKLLFLSSP